jgi:hypothetical protein
MAEIIPRVITPLSHLLSYGIYPKTSISCQRCSRCGEEGVRKNPSGKAGKGYTIFPAGKEYCIPPKHIAEVEDAKTHDSSTTFG